MGILYSLFKIGYDKNGLNRKGFDKFGFDIHGYDRDGFDKIGFNAHGFDHHGFDKFGYNTLGYNSEGFNKSGFNQYGYDENGYNKYGFDNNGFDAGGFDRYGFSGTELLRRECNGLIVVTLLHKNGTPFDDNGYDSTGFDKEGFDVDGFGENGGHNGTIHNLQDLFFKKSCCIVHKYESEYDRYGFNIDGYDRDGFDKHGYNQLGFDKTGFDKNGYNHLGFDKNGFNNKGLPFSYIKNKDKYSGQIHDSFNNYWDYFAKRKRVREIGSGKIEIDLHGLDISEANNLILNILNNLHPTTKQITWIHGYHSGTALLELLQLKISHERIVLIKIDKKNQGVTYYKTKTYRID